MALDPYLRTFDDGASSISTEPMRRGDSVILDGCGQILDDKLLGLVSDSHRSLSHPALSQLARVLDDEDTRRTGPKPEEV